MYVEPEEAINAYRRSLEISPHPGLRNNLASALVWSGRTAEALA